MNKESLLRYMEAIHTGIKGDVIDADTNRPVPNARIEIRGNQKVIRSTKNGEFWRLLPPGEYVISATANGYRRSEPKQVLVSD